MVSVNRSEVDRDISLILFVPIPPPLVPEAMGLRADTYRIEWRVR